MPSLIRLLVVLAVLAGLVYGGMLALVGYVTPKDKEVTLKIPARELVAPPDSGPVVLREIDTTRPTTPQPAPTTEAPAAAGESDVVTMSPGVE